MVAKSHLILRSLLLGLAAGWGCDSGQPGNLEAVVLLQRRDTLEEKDTVQFTAAAYARRCTERRGLLLQGVVGGNGVLLWLRSADSTVGGEYPVLARGDTVTPRGVAGSVRFMLGTQDRGITLDSGIVTVSAADGRIDATARGSGLDPSAAQRVALKASFAAVPMGADSSNCQVQVK